MACRCYRMDSSTKPGPRPADWENVILPETVTAENGVVTLDKPRTAQKEFFRLSRVE
jgi:hypothetical protein